MSLFSSLYISSIQYRDETRVKVDFDNQVKHPEANNKYYLLVKTETKRRHRNQRMLLMADTR